MLNDEEPTTPTPRRSGVNLAPWERSFDRILTPLDIFIRRQTTSGLLLMVTAVIALILANSPLKGIYKDIFHLEFTLWLGEHRFGMSLHHWINEGLMALFFFTIGLELKRELLVGELSRPRQALLPLIAAIGGMVVPALLYVSLNTDGHALDGWGVAMATDIAFAIGALSLLGHRVPKSVITFLIALAIVDDLGAVLVIALFYTDTIQGDALLVALGCLGVLAAFNRGGIRSALPYTLVGLAMWLAMLDSGVHATITGVLVAFTVPIRPKYDPEHFINEIRGLSQQMKKSLKEEPDIIHNETLRSQVDAMAKGVQLVQAPAQRFEHGLYLIIAHLIIPVFALANAGIYLGDVLQSGQIASPITLGVILGLLAGKPLGIAGFSWLALKAGLVRLPDDMRLAHVWGAGLLGGIGFTMSIFIADLAFATHPTDLVLAKIGILAASGLAGLSGVAWLFWLSRGSGVRPSPPPAAVQKS